MISIGVFELLITLLFIVGLLLMAGRLTLIKLIAFMLLHRIVLMLTRHYFYHIDWTTVLHRLITPFTVILAVIMVVLWIRQQQMKNNG